jgi:hypothetical protein
MLDGGQRKRVPDRIVAAGGLPSLGPRRAQLLAQRDADRTTATLSAYLAMFGDVGSYRSNRTAQATCCDASNDTLRGAF